VNKYKLTNPLQIMAGNVVAINRIDFQWVLFQNHPKEGLIFFLKQN